METEKLKQFKWDLESWIDFNSKSPLMLLDISKLLTIIRRYYIVKEKSVKVLR